jgi:hypothetical protein
MDQADRVLSTPPTNTSKIHHAASDSPNRRSTLAWLAAAVVCPAASPTAGAANDSELPEVAAQLVSIYRSIDENNANVMRRAWQIFRQ